MNYYYRYARGNASEAARLYRDAIIGRGGPQPEVYPDYQVILRTDNAYLKEFLQPILIVSTQSLIKYNKIQVRARSESVAPQAYRVLELCAF